MEDIPGSGEGGGIPTTDASLLGIAVLKPNES